MGTRLKKLKKALRRKRRKRIVFFNGKVMHHSFLLIRCCEPHLLITSFHAMTRIKYAESAERIQLMKKEKKLMLNRRKRD